MRFIVQYECMDIGYMCFIIMLCIIDFPKRSSLMEREIRSLNLGPVKLETDRELLRHFFGRSCVA